MKKNVNLLEGSIPSALIKLLIPQLGGFFAVTGFNFADSWFVSQMDNALPEHAESLYLSSISLTFPIVFGIGSIAIGLGVAVTTLISRAYGAGNKDLAKRLTRDAVILTSLFTLFVTCVGLFTIDPLFTFMGAKPEQLPLLREYMGIWYSGAVFMLIPMTCNNALRGYGNTFWPGVVMTTGALLNVILDPLLIFGAWKIPAMGVGGAAIATVIARITTAVISIFLVVKWDLIALKRPRLEEMLQEWKELLFYALPGIVGKVSMPLGMLGVTVVAASIGKNAVAALNASSRVEQMVLVAALALALVLMIFISQNLAAGSKERARKALNWAYKWIVVYALVCLAGLGLFSEDIAVWFNSLTGVQDMIKFYLLVVPLIYPFVVLSFIVQQAFFAIRKPLFSGFMDFFRFVVMMIPAAWIGAYLHGYMGMVIGLLISGLLTSIMSIVWFEYSFRRYTV